MEYTLEARGKDGRWRVVSESREPVDREKLRQVLVWNSIEYDWDVRIRDGKGDTALDH